MDVSKYNIDPSASHKYCRASSKVMQKALAPHANVHKVFLKLKSKDWP